MTVRKAFRLDEETAAWLAELAKMDGTKEVEVVRRLIRNSHYQRVRRRG